jgi:Kef-type K+ transport system membrane component KefB
MLHLVMLVLTAVVVLAVAAVGAWAARRLGQEPVVGEIVVGLLAGPALLWLIGSTPSVTNLLPGLTSLGEAGLTLYLVGATREIGRARGGAERSAIAWTAICSFAVPLCLGAGLGLWVLTRGSIAQRTGTSGPAFVIVVAVAMSITAVPVLARILEDRRVAGTAVGRRSLTAAVFQDSAGWLLLAAALALNTGTVAGFMRVVAVLTGGVLAALALRRLQSTLRPPAWIRGHPAVTACGLGTFALLAAFAMQDLGLTSIMGGVLVGLALPHDDHSPWARSVALVARAGRRVVPLYFVISGCAALTSAAHTSSWVLVLIILVLGTTGKVGGGYLGARLGGSGTWDAARTAALMNTRGLTEFVVLQVGVSAGLLDGGYVMAFAVLAVVTTAATGPALSLIRRLQSRRLRPGPAPELPSDPSTAAEHGVGFGRWSAVPDINVHRGDQS